VVFSNPLHVRCGDDILDKLRAAGLPGTRIKWCDPVCVGPTPRTENPEAWYRIRAEYLSHFGDQPLATVDAQLREQDRALLDLDSHDAVVLWFEHDLFDQSILIAVLSRLADLPAAKDRIYLVTTDRFPGHSRFIGLGQLSAEELSTLYEIAAPVSDEQIALARRAWSAWQAPDPFELQQLIDTNTGVLPFLEGAIRRHLQELPWRKDGLSLTQRRVLEALRDGPMSAGVLFERIQEAEEHPWMGDAMLFEELERMRFLESPLIRAASDKPIRRDAMVESTPLANEILDGAVDALDANPVDRWVGGVHVTSECPYRWSGVRVTSLASAKG
jgi:hypothetical protein